VFTRDRLWDDYEIHQRRNAHFVNEDLVNLAAKVYVPKPDLYRSLVTRLGDGLIAAGKHIKGHVDSSAAWSPTTRLT
jgi:hypothetical protein